MKSQWPILAAGLIIAAAAIVGLWKQSAAAMAAAPQPPLHASQPAAPAPAPAAPAVEALPAAQAQAAPPLPAAETKQIAQPVQPVAPVAPVQANPAPARPAAAEIFHPNQPARAPDPRAQLFKDLRATLQTKIAQPPLDLADGGFAFSVDGARVEVQPPPNWSVTIYNVNPKAQDAETDSFKTFMAAATAALGVDLSPKPVVSENGKSYLKTVSKAGPLSLVRDPATGNSCMIRPLQQWSGAKPPPAGTTPADAKPKEGDENF